MTQRFSCSFGRVDGEGDVGKGRSFLFHRFLIDLSQLGDDMNGSGLSDSVGIDRRIGEEGLDLRTLRRAIPPELLRPSELRSWLAFARVVFCVATMLWVLFQIELTFDTSLLWSLPALCAAWFVYGAVLLGFFLIGHDCGHGSFSKSKTVNRIVGYICMAPIFNGFQTWVLTHNHHHAHTQRRGEDVDWSSHLVTEEEFSRMTWADDFAVKLGYHMPFGIFWWIMWNALQRGSQVEPMLEPRLYQRHKASLTRSNVIMMIATLSVYGAFWYFTGFWGMVKYHGVPVLIASLLGGVVVAVGHANKNTIWYERDEWSPIRGQIVSTYDYRFPVWLEYLVLNINVHIPHHVSVRIPWYNLKAAAKILKDTYPDFYQELPFKFKDMAWIVWAPHLEKQAGRGYYQMKVRA